MSRKHMIWTATAAWLMAFVVNAASAQQPIQLAAGSQPSLLPTQVHAMPALPVSAHAAPQAAHSLQPQPGQPTSQYPYTGAAMYPCPIPNVPYQVGATMVTNQALAPHEMLYPHKYKALYPPFYYKVNGGWILTPWGVRSYDVWKLEGTMVKVKYKPRYSMFSGFVPPK